MKNMTNFGTPIFLKILTRFPEEIRPILDQELEFSDQHFEILDSETFTSISLQLVFRGL